MSNGINIRVESEGTRELLEILDKLPVKVGIKVLQPVLRKAARPLQEEVKQNLPEQFKSLDRAVITRNMRSFAGVKTGIYTKRVVVYLRGAKGTNVEFDAYYPLYWHNYGTLGRRDPTHKFTKPVSTKAHKFPGIRPLRFIQKAYDERFREVVQYAEDNLLKEAEKYLDRASARYIKTLATP